MKKNTTVHILHINIANVTEILLQIYKFKANQPYKLQDTRCKKNKQNPNTKDQ